MAMLPSPSTALASQPERFWPFRVSIPRLSWWIAGLVFLSTVIDYISRQTLSVAAPTLIRCFRLSNSAYAHTTAAFLVGYTIMPLMGGLLDWLGAKRALSLSVFWWSIISVLRALAQGIFSLLSLRSLLGLAEELNCPYAIKAVSEWFPPSGCGLAVGFFDSGSSVGSIIAVLLVALLVLHYGWRIAFACSGALGFFGVILRQLFCHPWQDHPALGKGQRQLLASTQPPVTEEGVNPLILSVLCYKEIWAVMLWRACTNSAWWFYVFWLP